MKTTGWMLATSCLLLAACAPHAAPTDATMKTDKTAAPTATAAAAAATPAAERTNPFFEESTLAWHLPPFDKITDADYRPAFEKGMADHLKEIDAIANDPAAPTFDNTVVAMERSGALLTRVAKTFFNLNASNTDDEMEKIESEMAPKLSAHQDAILLNSKLFQRVDTLWQQRAKLGLDPESAQLLDRYEKMFVRAGAKLSDADKEKLKKINEELSSLTTQFRQNVLKATKDGAVVVDDVKQLDGLSPVQIGAAAEAAKARGMEGKWLITLQNTTIQPPLEQLTNRALRERIYRASTARSNGGDADTTAIITKILTLRAQQAKLLGYPNYAAYALAEETAGTPKAADKVLGELGPAALAKAKIEAAEIQKLIDDQAKASHTKPFKLEPWDWAFYAAQVRKAKYDFTDADVKPYFEMNHVLEGGVFFAANKLYGITFHERKDLPVYQPDVRVFEVNDVDGKPLALLLLDYFKRDSKQGGAWMDTFVDQSTLLDRRPVVVNNLNIPKPAPGEPALLTFDEVTTMFHEFGHALHGMFADTKYPTLSGTAVPPDFVEFPSQFNEMWARDPAVLANIARNYKTGEPMPKALLDKVLAAQMYGQGYATLEYLEAAMMDLSLHQATAAAIPAPGKVMSFEAASLKKNGVSYAPVPPRYHATYFNHIFSGGQYAAGYYAYIWSEILARDSGAWFKQHGGLTRAAGDTFRKEILSRGRTEEPSVLFQKFYGHAPEIGPLVEYRGLTLPEKPGKAKKGKKTKGGAGAGAGAAAAKSTKH